MKRTLIHLVKNKTQGMKSVGITSYDYPTTKIIDSLVDFIVVGDTVGKTVHGIDNINQVSMDMMLTHCNAVAKASSQSFLIGDMPFMSYQSCTKKAIENAGKFIASGMDAVKLEGYFPDQVHGIHSSGMVVMGHLGLTPQSRARMGGYKIQAKTSHEIDTLMKQSLSIQDAGASLILLEAVPHDVGTLVTKELNIPVFGIGAGSGVDGQLVISHDILGMFWDFKPKFVKQYVNCERIIHDAVSQYSNDVRTVSFPSEEYFYKIRHEELEKYLGLKQWKYEEK